MPPPERTGPKRLLRRWKGEDDENLKKACEKYAADLDNNWEKIAEEVGHGRTWRACRERWNKTLKPPTADAEQDGNEAAFDEIEDEEWNIELSEPEAEGGELEARHGDLIASRRVDRKAVSRRGLGRDKEASRKYKAASIDEHKSEAKLHTYVSAFSARMPVILTLRTFFQLLVNHPCSCHTRPWFPILRYRLRQRQSFAAGERRLPMRSNVPRPAAEAKRCTRARRRIAAPTSSAANISRGITEVYTWAASVSSLCLVPLPSLR